MPGSRYGCSLRGYVSFSQHSEVASPALETGSSILNRLMGFALLATVIYLLAVLPEHMTVGVILFCFFLAIGFYIWGKMTTPQRLHPPTHNRSVGGSDHHGCWRMGQFGYSALCGAKCGICVGEIAAMGAL